MRHAIRLMTAAVTGSLVLSAPLAVAAPGGADPVARQQRHLVHAIDKKSDALDRAVRPARVGRLSEATKTALSANVAADQSELDALLAEVQAADTTYDFRAARKEVHANRATNYVLVVNVLRKAERLLATAPAGSTAATALTAVVTEGLTVDDDTDKAALRDLRKDLEGAKGLLAPSTGD